MKKPVLWAATACVVMLGLLWFVYRPWALTWGAERDEITRVMPGDSLISDPQFSGTRAITIAASAEEIWPWIIQIGYKRAGFYSYDRLDNDGIESARQILPEYQNLGVGDQIPLSAGAQVDVVQMEENRSLVLAFGSGERVVFTWDWGLHEESPNRSRLVTRLRVQHMHPIGKLMWDFGEIWMMRKCLLGIRERVESTP